LLTYLGASFVYVYASIIKLPIRPGKYAELYEEKAVLANAAYYRKKKYSQLS
jgi:hypothetical protein